MEKKNIHELPPTKRFKLMNPNKTTNPKNLPAKKRTELLYNSCTSACLPAKKRIWAPINFQIEDEEEEEIQTKSFEEIQQEEKQKIKPFIDLNQKFQEEEDEEKNETKSVKQIHHSNTKPLKEIDQELHNQEAKDESFEEINEEESNDGIICAVCQSTDGEPSDPIVFCDGCELMVHATCYGNPLTKSIPKGDWFCSSCKSKSTKTPKSCVLCPKKGGALKETTDNKWAHIMCSLLVPEVFFRDSEGLEGIDCSKVLEERWNKRCYVCEEKNGCVIFCAERKCELGFHVSCGLEKGNCVEYREGKGKGGDVVAGFCGVHTKVWEKQQLTGKFKIVATDKEIKRKN